MGTKLLAKVYVERECYICSGNGTTPSGVDLQRDEMCFKCKGKRKLWYLLGYTHAVSYEDALDILLPRIVRQHTPPMSKMCFLSLNEKYFLVWEKKALTAPIDISKAMVYRINKKNKQLMDNE